MTQFEFSHQTFPTSGPLVIPMTNDYLFRALLQRNNAVLKGLICSLLHLTAEEVSTAEITNPIELGTSFTDKTFIPVSNEPSGCLQTFGDCREGQIPRCSAALQV